METIYASAATLCLTTVVCAILSVLFPGEKTVKMLSLVLCLFVVVSVTSPFLAIIKSVTSESKDVLMTESEDNISEIIDDEVIKEAGDYLSEYVYSLLVSGGFNPIKTFVELKEDVKTGIYVDKLVIYFDSEYKESEEQISSLVETSLNINPVIVYEN